ncbi:MAG TPA: carboxypeptidase regulatory-like domain-containing protein [Blastocatellia bacterium]|nr:carboxypeptidase regulatory-like domain-containing protein [Blastocatellia bacterium]
MHEEARDQKRVKTALLAALFLALSHLPAPGQGGGPEGKDGPAEDSLYARTLPSVGFIYLRNFREPEQRPWRPKACAVIVRRDGVIATGYRGICRDDSDTLYDEIFFELPGGGARSAPARRYRLKPALIDKSYDLALLRAVPEPGSGRIAEPLDLPPLLLADSVRAQLLDELVIIGSAERGAPALSVYRGVVEGIDRAEQWIKTDARLLHGGVGIAVTSEGRLLGIPAKVIVDSQAIDRDGDGRPDAVRRFGAVAFLRPAHLVASMLNRLGEAEESKIRGSAPEGLMASPAPSPRQASEAPGLVTVKGLVRSAADGRPIAGARVGLVAAGSTSVTSASLLSWGGSNAEGRFDMNRRVPPGRYTARAVALGYEPVTLEVDIDEKSAMLVFELQVSR